MKIKYKTLIIGVISIILVILLTYLMFHIAYFGYINDNQKLQVEKSFDVISYMLDNELEGLESTAADWSHWDDTYHFIDTLNPEYVSSNLEYNTLSALNLKIMVFLDSNGEVLYLKHTDLDYNLLKNIKKKLLSKKDDLKALVRTSDFENIKSGIIVVEDQSFLVAVSPITTSDELSPSNGLLILVRGVDAKLINYIQNVTDVKVTLNEYNIGHFKAYEKLVSSGFPVTHQPAKQPLEAARIIKDINKNDSIALIITKENTDYNNIFYYFKFFIIGFLLVIILMSLFDLIIMDKYILKRLSKLNNFMDTVAATRDPSLSVHMPGNDEFNKLAVSTNTMLAQLDLAYKDISQMNTRFRMIMEATNDGYLDLNIKERDLYISPEWKKMIGYEGQTGKEIFRNYASKIHPECLERINELFKSLLAGASDYYECEYRVTKPSGDILWVLQRGKIVEKDANGNPIRLVSTLTNITERKHHEEEILFLSYSDKLTGLKNRAYMEEQFEKLDQNKDSHYFIIMGDLNGLKLTNDALGHKEGDKLLCMASHILKDTCESNDIISRWGGDEFIILVTNKDKDYISNLISKIKDRCNNTWDFHFKISFALGYAEKSSETSDTDAVMSLAEKRMYRNKLMENKSARSAAISSLSRTLHEKHTETEQHTLRIRNLSLKLGNRLSLSQDKLDELELLALLHDIGKIGIPDYILLKPDKLTKEEWNIMKTHTEIGYRIAKSTPELAHIADEILAHHERFDGTGYPTGLRGQEIPILSRIINIVDSFDVMTHKRAYKEAFSVDYAIVELKKCSGTQFDPCIVDEFIALIENQSHHAS